jgi:NAD(P)-dependent dehydrogenase (short-subunit alcohol dehydrogenase family)
MTKARYPDLANKAVLVTGGADGISRATVMAFGGQGGRVGFLDINGDKGEAFACELADLGATVGFRAVDLHDVAATPMRAAGRWCLRSAGSIASATSIRPATPWWRRHAARLGRSMGRLWRDRRDDRGQRGGPAP